MLLGYIMDVQINLLGGEKAIRMTCFAKKKFNNEDCTFQICYGVLAKTFATELQIRSSKRLRKDNLKCYNFRVEDFSNSVI